MVKICGRFRLWWFSKHWLCRDTSAKRLPYFRQRSAALGSRVAASSWQQGGSDPQKVAAVCRWSQCLASYVQAVRLHPLGTALHFPRKRKKIFSRFRGDKSLQAWLSAAGGRFKIFTPLHAHKTRKKIFYFPVSEAACRGLVSAAGRSFKIFTPLYHPPIFFRFIYAFCGLGSLLPAFGLRFLGHTPAAGWLLVRCSFPALHPVAGCLHRPAPVCSWGSRLLPLLRPFSALSALCFFLLSRYKNGGGASSPRPPLFQYIVFNIFSAFLHPPQSQCFLGRFSALKFPKFAQIFPKFAQNVPKVRTDLNTSSGVNVGGQTL